ncbi:putative LOG family protein YvdD [Paratrimastix pyriformis]|uniref:LOG family protein YvdD n=1 Tax=Paratrimastix pyriformis TaxID=342808 RepID=A0ABQ8UK35_9EUKA|nr:putative LOG family protein YvdD [Paratrimastix pyriformis]|eukprot:GAFH01005676.1.p2 GENE.GAFH01005676.1~~GAFH01005676.1.p2  ORF type:complete len:193 (+),score=42.72 GAFH01005676.1:20-598(+)
MAAVPTKQRTAVVFGSSAPTEGTPAYEEAFELGKVLAENGWKLMNGGYYGTMEATARGAASVPGAVVEGVCCRAVFPHRAEGGNQYLTIVTQTPNLFERIRTMAESGDVFICLPGSIGTLTELAMLWCEGSVARFTNKAPPKIYCYRKPWAQVVEHLGQDLGLDPAVMAHVRIVDGPADLMAQLARDLPAPN